MIQSSRKPIIQMSREEIREELVRLFEAPRHIGTVSGIDLYEHWLVPEGLVLVNPRNGRDGMIALRLEPWASMVRNAAEGWPRKEFPTSEERKRER